MKYSKRMRPAPSVLWFILVSLGIHGAMLKIPIAQEEPVSQATTSKPISIIKLPTPPNPQSLPTSTPSPQPTLSPAPPVTASIVPTPAQPSVAASIRPVVPSPSPRSPDVLPSPQSSPAPTPSAQESEASFSQTISQIKESGEPAIAIAPEVYFDQPGAFYAQSKDDPNSYDSDRPVPGFDGKFVYRKETSEQLLKTFFQAKQQPFQITRMADYGGGQVYQIQQGEFVRYLNLVPAKDSPGILVLIWDRMPS